MNNDNHNAMDQDLQDSIDMLKQILEVMPNDLEALKALYKAYRQSKNSRSAFEYLKQLAEVGIAQQDKSALIFTQQEIAHFSPNYPEEVNALQEELDAFSGTQTAVAPAPTEQGQPKTVKDISEELALAWRLYEENQLCQEEYSSVLHDLTEVSSKELNVPASVLHVLYDRGFTQMNRIMNYLSTRSGVPGITLSNFEISEEAAGLLPIHFPAHKGALPFGTMGDDLLLAVLNPFNYALLEEVETVGGRRCHTYLVDPEDYDLTLAKIRALTGTNEPAQP